MGGSKNFIQLRRPPGSLRLDANTASWVINVGKGRFPATLSQHPLAWRLYQWWQMVGQQVCSLRSSTTWNSLNRPWMLQYSRKCFKVWAFLSAGGNLLIRLDVTRFMRRFAFGYTSKTILCTRCWWWVYSGATLSGISKAWMLPRKQNSSPVASTRCQPKLSRTLYQRQG